MRFNVRVRIVDSHKRAIHEDQIYEAETGLDAMKMAEADEKNTSRGLVQTNGADSLPADPVIMPVKGVDDEPVADGDLAAGEPMLAPVVKKKPGRKPKDKAA